MLKPLAVSMAIGLATLAAPAYSMPYQVTVTGMVGDSLYNVNGYTGTIAYDPSAILGKPFTLVMTYDATGAVNRPVALNVNLPGAVLNNWQPVTVSFTLTIDGGLGFSNTDSQNTRIESFNDVTVPASFDLREAPLGILHGHTYDGFTIGTGEFRFKEEQRVDDYLATHEEEVHADLVDEDNDPGNVYESFSIVFDYFWDTAQHNALLDNSLPNPMSFDFTKGFGGADINFTRRSPDPNDSHDGDDIARIYLTAHTVTVAAVPEPETYALLLAGLGLVGYAARRRKSA